VRYHEAKAEKARQEQEMKNSRGNAEMMARAGYHLNRR